jgi:hypothetical protein
MHPMLMMIPRINVDLLHFGHTLSPPARQGNHPDVTDDL